MCVLTRATVGPAAHTSVCGPAYVGVCTVTRKCATCLWLQGWGLKGPRETTRELGLPEGAGGKDTVAHDGVQSGEACGIRGPVLTWQVAGLSGPSRDEWGGGEASMMGGLGRGRARTGKTMGGSGSGRLWDTN